MAFHQSVAHGVQDGPDGKFGVALRELAESGSQGFNKVRSGHWYG